MHVEISFEATLKLAPTRRDSRKPDVNGSDSMTVKRLEAASQAVAMCS
jgi:hypothetical protein